MDQIFKRMFFLAVLAILVFNALTTAARLPRNSQFEPYDSRDFDSDMESIDEPVKRGLCRNGFTFQAVLRECLPSKGLLRIRATRDGFRFLGLKRMRAKGRGRRY